MNEPPHQQKIKVRAALRECKNLEYTYVVTGPYGNGESHLYLSPNAGHEKAGSFDPRGKKAVVLGTGNESISLTTMRDVGKLVVAALLHSAETRNKALRVNSFTTTNNDLVAEFERQTGQKWDVQHTSLDELKALEKKAYEDKSPVAGVYTLRRIWTEGGTLYEKRDNFLIEAEEQMDTVEDAVRGAIKVQEAK